MTLLERESASAALGGFAAEAEGGAGRLVLVVGEAGVGKSALIEQFERDQPGARWVWGACDGLFTPRPLAPLYDIAERLGGELFELARADASREELFRALLRQASDPGRLTVIVVEDIHWADEATLDLLRFLARRIRSAPVLLIATYRDEGMAQTDLLRRGLGELVTQGLSSRLELAPLSLDAVRTLSGPSGLPAEDLHRLTGGNPFYVVEVLRTGTGEVPTTTRDVILARTARLPAPAYQTLEAAALIGSRIDVTLLETTGASPDVIDELVASGQLVGDGAHLRFRHEIARIAVEQAVPAHRRGAIHRRILAALTAAECDDDARLAFHAEGAADGPAVLLHARRAAARAAALSSHKEAVAQYQRALRFVSGLDAVAIAELYDRLVIELSLIDRWSDAADAGERALELWRAVGDPRREGDTLRRRSKVMWRLCRGREAHEDAAAALAILEPLGPSVELAWAYSALAANRMMLDDNQQAIALASQAQALAESVGADDVLSDALNTEGCAAAMIDGDWQRPLERALSVALAGGLEEQAGRAFANLHDLYCQQLRFDDAHRYFTEGIAYSDEHDMGTYARCLRGAWAGVLVQTGRWPEAEELAQQLLSACEPLSVNGINPLMCLATVLMRRGDADASALLDQLVAAAEGSGAPAYVLSARLTRAEAHWLKGDLELARREVELADDVGAGDRWQRGALAMWLRRVGSTRALPADTAEPYRSQLAGDWRQAAEAWTAVGCTYESALARLDSNDEAALREALAVFDELDATPAARITRQRMRAVGIRSIPTGRRSSTRAHPLGLTQREREVLELICDGFTNAEIAAELVISPRTVDHHVSSILAKLDAPTRNVAAIQAVELGLVAS